MDTKKSIGLYLVICLVAIFILNINLLSAYNLGSSVNTSLTLINDNKVAYIYNQEFQIDQNIVEYLESIGLEVENIKYTQILRTDLSQYKFILINDEKFPMSYVSKIPVKDYNSVVINYNHGKVWGLTDSDGISKLAASHPLSVLVNEDLREYTVYTDGFFREGSTLAIPYYYLGDGNKANSFMPIARTIDEVTGNEGDVVAYLNESSRLVNGQITNGKMCFYGIAKSDYWTPKAKELFSDCITFIASKCSKDSDCPEPSPGEDYCINESVYRDSLVYSCINPGELNAECIAAATPELVEVCPTACFEGSCVECNIDSDCDDDNNYTYDFCENHFCGHQPINCTYNSDCNDENLYTYDECINPGTPESYCNYTAVNCVYNSDCGESNLIGDLFCLNDNLYMLFENITCQNPGMIDSYCSYVNESVMNRTCLFGCNGDICFECTNNDHCDDNNSATFDYCSNNTCYHNIIQCNNDEECNDGNSSTIDQCQNPGTINSQCIHTAINCASNADCGITGYIGSEFCSSNDVFKTFKNATCINAGTTSSHCVITQEQILVNDCGNDYCTNTGSLYCYNGDVYQMKLCYYNNCINESISHCSSTSFENATLVTDCLYGCSNGACSQPVIECSSNSECNDGDSYTQDV
ncbi:MAG TPA: hypothetical protein P5277_02375, partial [Candidatus Paceibacterota bacterium]|nr:hypothetical protein [Candidatus Paceibacterota bacterium]